MLNSQGDKKKRGGSRDLEILLKTELLRRGILQVRIAKDLQVTSASVTQCIKGQAVSKRFDAWVLLHLDIDIRKIRKERDKAA